jgi:exopolysaccharide production protein ExoY
MHRTQEDKSLLCQRIGGAFGTVGPLKQSTRKTEPGDSNYLQYGAASRAQARPAGLVVVGPRVAGFYVNYGKRLLDIFIATLAMVILSPVMLAAAVIVATSDGLPVIYCQARAGGGLRPFIIAKFRTMYQNCEGKPGSWKKSDPQWQEQAGSEPQRDPRILPGAAVLRRFSVDELPQLWNVLRGDMSIIGPRPLLISQVEENFDRIGEVLVRRAAVLPGITGLWQVSGRSDVTFERMLLLDVEYVKTLSFRTDLVILLRTIKVVLRGSGAA